MNAQSLWQWLRDSTAFSPRNQCGPGWTPALEATHRVCELAILFAYLAIPAFMWTFVFMRQRRKNDVPRSLYVFTVCATAFIVSCGMTHLFGWLAFTWPMYRLDAVVKAACAMFSWCTVAAMPVLIMQGLELPSRTEFEAKTHELQREVDSRKLAEQDLRNANAALRSNLAHARAIVQSVDKESKSVEDGLRDLIRRMEITTGE